MPDWTSRRSTNGRQALTRAVVLLLAAVVVGVGAFIWFRATPSTPIGATASGASPTVSSSMSPAASKAVAATTLTEAPASATPQPTATVMPVPTGYTVTIAKGLHPKWNAEAAASAMMNTILWNERRTGRVVAEPLIISVEAMAGSDAPTSIGGPFPGYPVCWVVHAHGTFTGTIDGGAAYGSDGWVIYDDSGDSFATHFVFPMPSP